MLVVQSDAYNRTRLRTVLAAAITSNTRLAAMPGNVFLPAGAFGLSRDSVVNVTALVAADRSEFGERVGSLDAVAMAEVDRGLRLVLNL